MDQIITYAKQLRLPYISSNIKEDISQANIENLSYEEFLKAVLEREVLVRKENGIKKRIKRAKFPFEKRFDELIIEELPVEAQKYMKYFKDLSFIDSGQNIIMYGVPGTGKTHISTAIGIKACCEGKSAYFAHVPDLITELKEAKNGHVLTRLKNKLMSFDVLILDELGYTSFDKHGAELLFNIISARAEKKTTIITTNLPFDRWIEIFHDPIITSAIVDRITHKSFVVNMCGESYRIKQSKEFISTIS